MVFSSNITMYRAALSEAVSARAFERVDCRPLSDWYASFPELTSVARNEALLCALETAREDGHAQASDAAFRYLFFEGRHPARSMIVDEMPDIDLTVLDTAPDALDIELGRRRIAWSPKAFHGDFMSPDGSVTPPEHEIVVRWQATTRQAVLALGVFDFEDCEAFLGERVIELARLLMHRDEGDEE